VRKTCLDMIYELALKDDRIIFIGSDLGVGTLDRFKDEMPERFFMEGINEANIIGMAAGLALEERIVYVNTIASFLTRRCFEQVGMDLCLHKVNVRLIGNGGGLVYAPLGPTHEAVEDIAIFRALPGMTVLAPADAEEMRRAMPLTVDHPGPVYIRLGKGGDPVVSSDRHRFAIGKGLVMCEGSDALVITTGVMLKAALDSARMLAEEKIKIAVLHMPTVKPLDVDCLLKYAGQVPVIVTLEEHSVIGGLGSAVMEIIGEANFPTTKKCKRLGIPDVYPDKYGSQASLMMHYGLTADNLTKTIKQLQAISGKEL
jgi:transketolase